MGWFSSAATAETPETPSTQRPHGLEVTTTGMSLAAMQATGQSGTAGRESQPATPLSGIVKKATKRPPVSLADIAAEPSAIQFSSSDPQWLHHEDLDDVRFKAERYYGLVNVRNVS